MTGRHRLDPSRGNDTIPPWGRVIIYVLAIALPFVSVAIGATPGESAVAAAVTLVAAVGPALAIVYTPSKKDDDT